MQAIWNNEILAVSDDVVEVEGNIYFPLESLRAELVQASETHTHCPWKGDASYLTLSVGGETNADAAWFYPQPMQGAEIVAGRVAFWKGVEIVSDAACSTGSTRVCSC
jgi:uncharacterized protein (DUF427 family)